MEKQKIAYLTIDDAPTPNMKKKADFLLSKKIPAIWFCLGEQLEEYPELAKYLIEKGFIVGNHSYDHPHFSELPLDQCLEQIRKTDMIIHNLYSEMGISEYPKVFRFPYLDKGGLTGYDYLTEYTGEGKQRRDKINQLLHDLGYIQGKFPGVTYEYAQKYHFFEDLDWLMTYDTVDYSIRSEEPNYGIQTLEDVFERMEEDVPEEGRGLNYMDSEDIILIHDHTETDNEFIPIIERLLEKGIMFKTPIA